MLAAVIVIIALVGAMAYRYYATLDARKADIQLTAARNAMMILESWRGKGGDDTFNATSLASTGLTIASVGSGGPAGGLANVVSRYTLTNSDGVVYYVTLSTAPADISTPKALNVQIGWRQDRSGAGWTNATKARDPLGLTTYVSD